MTLYYISTSGQKHFTVAETTHKHYMQHKKTLNEPVTKAGFIAGHMLLLISNQQY